MRRWVRDRRLLAAAVGVIGIVVGAAWIFVEQTMPPLVEDALTRALGVPIHVRDVGPLGTPPGVRIVGLQVGAAGEPALSAARVYLYLDVRAWFAAGEKRVRVEVWGPRVRTSGEATETVWAVLNHLAHGGGSWTLEDVVVDEITFVGPDGSRTRVAGFQVSQIETRRKAGASLATTAELTVVTATGQIVAEVERASGTTTLLVGAEIDDAPIGLLVPDADVGSTGTVSGRLWYESAWTGERVSQAAGGDLWGEMLSLATHDGGRAEIERFSVEGARLDVTERRADVERLDAARLSLPASWWEGASPLEGWTARLGEVRLDSIRGGELGGRVPVTVRRLELSNVQTDAGSGHIELDAEIGQGALALEAEASPGRLEGSLQAEGLPLPALMDGTFEHADVVGGSLSADLVFGRRPGLAFDGTMTLRDVRVDGGARVGGRALLVVPEAALHVQGLSFDLPSDSVWQAVLRAPEMLVRRDGPEETWQEAWFAPWSRSPPGSSWLGGVGARLRRAFELPVSAPPPSMPIGVRATDGELVLEDAGVTPPARLRLRSVEALVDGPDSVGGPLRIQLAGRGPLRSQVELDYRDESNESTVHVAASGLPLTSVDPYLESWTGYPAAGGQLDARIHGTISPATDLDVSCILDGVALGPTVREDRLSGILGEPFPAVLERLQAVDGTARLRGRVVVEASASDDEVREAWQGALRDAVDAAQGRGRSSKGGRRKRP